MKKILLVITGLFLLLAGVIIGIIIVFNVYHNSHVVLDGPSMEPTLHNGQSLTVTKYENSNQVKRGDIVEYHSSSDLVKKYSKIGKLLHRVVALPGERIVVSSGKVTVYSTEHSEGFNPDTYLSSAIKTDGSIDTTLPAGKYFVMGDNRPNALDSRATGPISFSDIIGKVSQ